MALDVPRSNEAPPLAPEVIQSLFHRRLLIGTLAVALAAILAAWLVSILAVNGFDIIDAIIVLAFLIYSPWLVIWPLTSLLGLFLLNATENPIARILLGVKLPKGDEPIVLRNAIVMTVRNEDPAAALAHLKATLASLQETGESKHFHYFVLSDSTLPELIRAEEKAVAALRAEVAGKAELFYRRRTTNEGFKAGNVRDFCERWGNDYDVMLLLDADSIMRGELIVRLTRVMQVNPRIGILQSLTVGLPTSAFLARVFQFGHRVGSRCFITGALWWQGDCCNFWGHNALIRLRPFIEHCRMPRLSGDPPFGGDIIGHDQIEAAFMRRAGYELRVWPEQGGSYEGNPPRLTEMVQRTSRWCQGNFQNLRLLTAPGLVPMSRFHLLFIADQNFGSPAIVTLVIAAAVAAALWRDDAAFPAASALALYVTCVLLYLTPRLTGLADIAIRSATQFGGAGRLLLGGLIEIVLTILLVPLSMFMSAFSTAVLLLKRTMHWEAQDRSTRGLAWKDAIASFWIPTAFGLAILLFLYAFKPDAIPLFLPFLSGLLLSVPFAVATSLPEVGALTVRWGLCAVPEEIDPPVEIRPVLSMLVHEA
ncbi:MAG TPA: glucans biosynthesis glucosyltransferase MdoH [Xanthobacteraceae bacterium]|nr:glucans biosynthesis glucosyltransferase MdoH [Xanthobacteraceae bacterium]